ncbi:RusA family crossover junction endodeoxyribonuclease [Streptomyces fuscigenes]|uniref:RusA family crossover junction endodeoxyribonuclease n=1 Tax=Streptomyces fuscigenes TaxID=1528880 RepID=UPI001F2661D6|nr:RusA family crossover junction endodeoxyribonuclease [Streptomyces fuscigenes]MCF3960332.1 RusA family crossover junction endodeoxyribonuclease [Streptomyces fuscigenes]
MIDVPLWEDDRVTAAVALDEASALLDDALPDEEPAPAEPASPPPAFEVTVYGAPAPQGSKSAKRNKHTNRIHLVESSKYVKPWREDVVGAALVARGRGWKPLTGPLAAEMVFTLTRPRSHFGTGRNAEQVRPSAPAMPAGVPDLSKLARSTEDALTTAGIYRDDALLVEYRRLVKRYHTDHGQVRDVMEVSGCVIRLWRLEEEPGR